MPVPCFVPKPLTEEQQAAIARALADPRRYELLKRIGASRTPTPCAALVADSDISPATLSHHMKELEAAGLIRAERAGKFMHYTAERPVLRAFLSRLKSDLI